MNPILGIDSSERSLSVALVSGSKVLAQAGQDQLHTAEHLLAMVQAVLNEAGVKPPELRGLSVSIGPGSFTGIRSGIALAQGLGAGLGIPVLGISSLLARLLATAERDGLAERDPPIEPDTLLLGHTTAFPGEVFWSGVELTRSAERMVIAHVLPICVCPQSEVQAEATRLGLERQKPVRVVALDGPEFSASGSSPAAACAAGFAYRDSFAQSAAEVEPQFQLTGRGVGLEPLYGKGVQAQTLVERMSKALK